MACLLAFSSLALVHAATARSNEALTQFADRVRITIAPIAHDATATTLEPSDATTIRTAAITAHHSAFEQRKLRVLEWLGVVPSKHENGPPALPDPSERAAYFDSERSRVLIALADGALSPADEPEAFTAIAAADMLSLSTVPIGDDARRTRVAVANAIAQRICWLELARAESGWIAAQGAQAAFSMRGAVLDRMAASAPRPIEPWFRGTEEFTSIVARDFVDRAIGFGGSEGLTRILRNPPRSSEQLLHPEKYFDPAQHDEPTPIVAFDLALSLGDAWTSYLKTELGEFESGRLLRAAGDPLRALKARRGFDGDDFRVYEHGTTKALLLHWTIALDRRAETASPHEASLDAIEFIDALRKVLERRYSGSDPQVHTTLDENSVGLSSIEPLSGRYHAQAYRWQDRVELLLCDDVALDLEHLLSDHP